MSRKDQPTMAAPSFLCLELGSLLVFLWDLKTSGYISDWLSTVLLRHAGGDDDPYVTSFRGLDCPTYYMTDTEQYVQLLNYSGCGNTTNANHPVMQRLIMDSLRM